MRCSFAGGFLFLGTRRGRLFPQGEQRARRHKNLKTIPGIETGVTHRVTNSPNQRTGTNVPRDTVWRVTDSENQLQTFIPALEQFLQYL
jgi:hypothetical protein